MTAPPGRRFHIAGCAAGVSVIHLLDHRTQRLLRAYLVSIELPAPPVPAAPPTGAAPTATPTTTPTPEPTPTPTVAPAPDGETRLLPWLNWWWLLLILPLLILLLVLWLLWRRRRRNG